MVNPFTERRERAPQGLIALTVGFLLILSGPVIGKQDSDCWVQLLDTAGVRLVRFCAGDDQSSRYVHDLDVVTDTQETCASSVAVSDDGWIHVVWTNQGHVFYAGTREQTMPWALTEPLL